MARGLKTPHHFTLPYSPWSNGAIKRLGREGLRIFRAIISELQLPLKEYLDLIHVGKRALNNTPSLQHDGLCPVTIFTGLNPAPPITAFKRGET